jgi:hypothetical protein
MAEDINKILLSTVSSITLPLSLTSSHSPILGEEDWITVEGNSDDADDEASMDNVSSCNSDESYYPPLFWHPTTYVKETG